MLPCLQRQTNSILTSSLANPPSSLVSRLSRPSSGVAPGRPGTAACTDCARGIRRTDTRSTARQTTTVPAPRAPLRPVLSTGDTGSQPGMLEPWFSCRIPSLRTAHRRHRSPAGERKPLPDKRLTATSPGRPAPLPVSQPHPRGHGTREVQGFGVISCPRRPGRRRARTVVGCILRSPFFRLRQRFTAALYARYCSHGRVVMPSRLVGDSSNNTAGRTVAAVVQGREGHDLGQSFSRTPPPRPVSNPNNPTSCRPQVGEFIQGHGHWSQTPPFRHGNKHICLNATCPSRWDYQIDEAQTGRRQIEHRQQPTGQSICCQEPARNHAEAQFPMMQLHFAGPMAKPVHMASQGADGFGCFLATNEGALGTVSLTAHLKVTLFKPSPISRATAATVSQVTVPPSALVLSS
jgi:hypothetical protein